VRWAPDGDTIPTWNELNPPGNVCSASMAEVDILCPSGLFPVWWSRSINLRKNNHPGPPPCRHGSASPSMTPAPCGSIESPLLKEGSQPLQFVFWQMKLTCNGVDHDGIPMWSLVLHGHWPFAHVSCHGHAKFGTSLTQNLDCPGTLTGVGWGYSDI